MRGNAPELTPTREQTTALSALPPGLVFGTNTGLWQVGEDGQPRQILNRSDVVLSPDGTQALYTTPDADLWLIDLTTGAERNLTHTPNRMECCPQWWPARPDTIILGSWPKDADPGPSTGFLTTVRVDGSDYRVLSEHQSNALPAPAPDGQTIACDQGGGVADRPGSIRPGGPDGPTHAPLRASRRRRLARRSGLEPGWGVAGLCHLAGR